MYPKKMAEDSSFKSIDPRITCTDDIDDLIGYSLSYQHTFNKTTAPWEMKNWMEDELENFMIDHMKIDRVYYIYHFDDDCSGQDFELIARMTYKSQPLYVQMNAGCDYTGFDCQGDGSIYVSRDADMFMKTVLDDRKHSIDHIYELLMADGIYAVWILRYDTAWRKKMTTDPPMLKFLCHNLIVERNMPREYYSNVLPKILVDSVDDHKKTQIARKNYDDM